jgi:hypothetical protein
MGYICNGELFNHKKDKIVLIMLFAGKWLKLEITMLSEISQAQKTKYPMYLDISGIYTHNDDEDNKNNET